MSIFNRKSLLKYLIDPVACAGWWYKPEYIINQLSIQSVISSPAHDEKIPFNQEMYTMKGYAYSGRDCDHA